MDETVNKSRRGVMKAGLMLATAGVAAAGTARAQDQNGSALHVGSDPKMLDDR